MGDRVGSRGRTSSAALELVGTGGIVAEVPRPAPPDELNEEQAAEWRNVVNRLPADWFPAETHSMLAQYCRHVIAARRIGQLVARAESGDEFDLREYDKLLQMQDREGRAMSSLATRMRMTQQSTYSEKKSKGGTISGKPWEK